MANYIDLGLDTDSKAAIGKQIEQANVGGVDSWTDLIKKTVLTINDDVKLSHPIVSAFDSYAVPVGAYLEHYKFESLAQGEARNTDSKVSDIPQAFDEDASKLFARLNIEAKPQYFAIARKSEIPMTLEDTVILQSFNDASQMNSYVSARMLKFANNVFLSDYAAVLQLVYAFAVNPDNFATASTVTIDTTTPLDDSASNVIPSADQIALVEKIIYQILRLADNFTRPNDAYNKIGGDTQTSTDSLCMIVTPEFEHIYPFALKDIYHYGLIDIDKIKRYVVDEGLPVSADGKTTTQVLLFDKKIFEVHDALNVTKSQPSAEGLYTNFFRHRWAYYVGLKDYNVAKIEVTDTAA